MIEYEIIIRLVIATIFGGLLGFERSLRHKEAGLKTYTLVTLGSTIFTICAILFSATTSTDPSRIIGEIVSGVGFIGAGVIFKHWNKTEGITTAAGLWVASAVGVAIGLGYYLVALISFLLITMVYTALFQISYYYQNKENDSPIEAIKKMFD